MEYPHQRDAFWGRIYELARQDHRIVVVCADMGAPALDRFKRDLPGQFVDVGIAEQQAVLLSSGLALEGKKVFAYAIAPFITLRCYEQIRVNLAGMDLPVTLVGVGAGISYEESGPTHHSVEDIAVLRILPNLTVHSASDSTMAAHIADLSCVMKHPNYVRLDRQLLPPLHGENTDFSKGFVPVAEGRDGLIVATGSMVQKALEVSRFLREEHGVHMGVVDLFAIPNTHPDFVPFIAASPAVFTLEEHVLPGGMGSWVLEALSDAGETLPVRRIGLDLAEGYCYRYGGREAILNRYGLDTKGICRTILAALRKA